MKALDRTLIIVTAVLLGAVVAICWHTSTALQRNFTVADNVIPWPPIIEQAISSMAGPFALVGLASAAGLLFLRAARWNGIPTDDEEPTPEPSP